MTITIRRSLLEPDLFEVWQQGQMVEEIFVPFQIKHIPATFYSVEKVKAWLQETEWKLVRNYAYRLIAMRSYPTTLLLRKLQARRYSNALCQRIVEELQKNGLIKDDEYVESLIRRELRRGYGPKWIKMKLRSMGIDAEVNITAPQQLEQICKFKARYEKQKAIRLLMRRGFDTHLIRKAFP